MGIRKINGWVPYGFDDPDVIIKRDLCSALSTSNMPFNTLITSHGTFSGAVHDAKLGMQANTGSYRFQVFNGNANGNAAMDNGFQISLEVQRKWLCVNNIAVGSDGFTSVDECAMAFIPTTQAGTFRVFEKLTDVFTGRQFNTTSVNVNYLSGATENMAPHSIGKDDYVTINMGFIPSRVGGTVIYAVDGLILAKRVTSDPTFTGLLANMYIGSGVGALYCTYYIRNLQVVARPPAFYSHPQLSNVVIWGDSMAFDLSYADGIMYDNTPALSMMRKLAKKDLYPGKIACQTNAGYNLGTYTGSSKTSLSTVLTTLQAAAPLLVIISAGSNDMTDVTFNEAEMRSSIASRISTILGWNSNIKIILRGVPTGYYQTNLLAYTATHAANRVLLDNYYKELVTTHLGRVFFADAYKRLKGESPDANTYIGQQTGLLTNLHLSSRGGLEVGNLYAESIIEKIIG